MLNAVKHLSRYTAMYVLGAFGGSVAYAIIFKTLFGASESTANFITGAVFGICITLCFAFLVSIFASYASIALTMGSTRKGLFLATQLQKLLIAAGMFITLLVNNALVPYLYGGKAAYSLDTLILLGAVCILFAALGESIGVLCVRFGKVGMYIYIGICTLFGGAVGMLLVSNQRLIASVAVFVASLSAWAIFACVLIIAAALSLISWSLFRKTSIKL